jgi:hypothetical protein
MSFPDSQPRLPRRTVFKWFAAAAAALHGGDLGLLAADAPAADSPAVAKGYGTDPKLSGFYNPGDFWPLTLTPAHRETVTALADVILPADDLGPAASELRVPDFIDEWISAPYSEQQRDRGIVSPGLDWLEEESQRRFSARFARLTPAQQRAICDDICSTATATPPFKQGAVFFARFRALAAGAYYGTPQGWKAIGYVGNVPSLTFDGPPPEVLARLGVEQTVK